MHILILNGPNLNLLGIREPDHYGTADYAALERYVQDACREAGVLGDMRQSNHEGVLLDWIQEARDVYDGLIINAAAYTHTSVALLDAILAVQLPAIEVHLTDPAQRESFRHVSYVGRACRAVFKGMGFAGYRAAIFALRDLLQESKSR